jgi:hypothetical protein
MKINTYLKKIVRDHHTVMFVGVMFIIMGMINLNDHLLEKLIGMEIKIGHGMILMGVFNVFLSITFLINGISTVEAGLDAEKPAPDLNKMQQKINELEQEIKILKKK